MMYLGLQILTTLSVHALSTPCEILHLAKAGVAPPKSVAAVRRALEELNADCVVKTLATSSIDDVARAFTPFAAVVTHGFSADEVGLMMNASAGEPLRRLLAPRGRLVVLTEGQGETVPVVRLQRAADALLDQLSATRGSLYYGAAPLALPPRTEFFEMAPELVFWDVVGVAAGLAFNILPMDQTTFVTGAAVLAATFGATKLAEKVFRTDERLPGLSDALFTRTAFNRFDLALMVSFMATAATHGNYAGIADGALETTLFSVLVTRWMNTRKRFRQRHEAYVRRETDGEINAGTLFTRDANGTLRHGVRRAAFSADALGCAPDLGDAAAEAG